MKLKFVSGLIQIASLRFIEALEGSKITEGNSKNFYCHDVFFIGKSLIFFNISVSALSSIL